MFGYEKKGQYYIITIALIATFIFCALPTTAYPTKYETPIDHTLTIDETDIICYSIVIENSKMAQWSISVSTGSSLDVYFIDSSQYFNMSMGRYFEYYATYSDTDSKSASDSYMTDGSYYLVVTMNEDSSGTSTYHASITISKMEINVTLGIIVGVILAIVIPVIIIVIVLYVRKKPSHDLQPVNAGPATGLPCPVCGASMNYLQHQNMFHCARCNAYRPANQ